MTAGAGSADPVAAVAGVLRGAAGPVLIGFSGGLDSTVLLHAAALARRASSGPELVAVHVNHGLQPEADAWEAHCARIAEELGVAFRAHRVVVARRGSLEAAARAARYAAFAGDLEQPGVRLLLAHHRDDQAETVLLRLLQGRGLYGMPAERPLGAGRVLRPLLGIARSDLLLYAERHGLAWLEDPSNADLALDRNFVRHQVLPLLRARFPALDAALLEAMAARRAEDALLARSSGGLLAETVVPLEWLLAQEPGEQLGWLRLWLAAHARALPTARALRTLLAQLRAGDDRQPRLALDRGELRRYRGNLWLLPPAPALAAQYPLAAPGRLDLPHGTLTVAVDADGFAARGPLVVRFRRGGERIRAAGHERSVKQLLQAHGVPPWERSRYPLVFDADGLAAVPGIAQRDVQAMPGASAAMATGPRLRAAWRGADPRR